MACRLYRTYSRGGILGTWAEFCVRGGDALPLRRNFDPFGRVAFWAKISKLISAGVCKRLTPLFGAIWCSQVFGRYFLFIG
jgi:hypothetical protein